MKFNVEVEIDWLEDGGGIDDAVKQEIINGIVNKLSMGFTKDITKDSLARVNAKIDELVIDLFEKFITKGVTVTDQWGEPEKINVNIESLSEPPTTCRSGGFLLKTTNVISIGRLSPQFLRFTC